MLQQICMIPHKQYANANMSVLTEPFKKLTDYRLGSQIKLCSCIQLIGLRALAPQQTQVAKVQRQREICQENHRTATISCSQTNITERIQFL